jgi:hypothetical protein
METVVLHTVGADAPRMFPEWNNYYTALTTMSELKIPAYCVIGFNVF